MKHTLLAFVLLAGCSSQVSPDVATEAHALETVPTFGSNPGNLKMYRYVPTGAPKGAPLVIALHGCTQKAADFEAAGWSTLAESKKFYVVYPEQTSGNNPVSCFNWWGKYNQPADKTNITRGKGEPESIKQMVDKMKTDYAIDPSRVFIVGFSAGGAEAAVMLALYPDVFAAGAMLAGVPYDCPSTANADVWSCMSPGKDLTPAQWGDRVRAAFPWKGSYPRVSIWQGEKDTTVSTNNQRELIDQWTNLHGVSITPSATDTIATNRRHRYGASVESWHIAGMGHGVPLDPAKGCGKAGAYALDAKICSTTYIAEWFGLDSAAPPPPPPPLTDAGPPPPVDASPPAILRETVSSGPDLPWTLGGWDVAPLDHTGVAGSQSLHARVASSMGKSAKTATLTVRGSKLRYARRLSLRGANIASSARFAIEVDGVIVDEKLQKLGSTSETDWSVSGELAIPGGKDVTLRLIVSIDDPWSFASSAEAFIDDLEIR